MHLRKLNRDLGWYYPNSFCIHLAEDEIEAGELTNPPATLFHEYIHFLQDVTTRCGCFNLIHYCNSLKIAQRHCVGNPAEEIALPLSKRAIAEAARGLSARNVSDFCQSRYEDISCYICGNCEEIDDRLILRNVKHEDEQISDIHRAPCVYLELERKSGGDPIRFRMGSHAIAESMAAACEAAAYSESLQWRTQFPYNAAYLVASYLGAENIIATPTMLSAACELALQTDRPAIAFLDILELSKRLRPIDVRSFVQDCLGSGILETKTSRDVVMGEAKAALLDVLEFIPESSRTRVWVTEMVQNAASQSKGNPAYISNAVRTLGRDAFHFFQNQIGLPLVVDGKGKFITDRDLSFDLFPIAGLEAFVHSAMPGGDPGRCGLEWFCSTERVSMNVNYDSGRCRSPWVRARDPKLCPVGLWYAIFGFAEKTASVGDWGHANCSEEDG